MQLLSFGFGFTALSILLHLFRADRKSKVGGRGGGGGGGGGRRKPEYLEKKHLDLASHM